jgi:hypothetical protein
MLVRTSKQDKLGSSPKARTLGLAVSDKLEGVSILSFIQASLSLSE